MVLAWEYLQEVFVTLVFISFLILFFILFPGYFTMPQALHPSFSDPWRPPPALSSTPTTFDCFLLFHLPQALRFWVGIFYSQAFFTLSSFPTFLVQPAFIKASLGACSSTLKFAGFILILKTQTPPICLFDSQWSAILYTF